MKKKREEHRFASSRVDRASYDPDRREILVTFTDGVRWVYGEVNHNVWIDFVSSASAGNYVNTVLTKKYPNRAA